MIKNDVNLPAIRDIKSRSASTDYPLPFSDIVQATVFGFVAGIEGDTIRTRKFAVRDVGQIFRSARIRHYATPRRIRNYVNVVVAVRAARSRSWRIHLPVGRASTRTASTVVVVIVVGASASRLLEARRSLIGTVVTRSHDDHLARRGGAINAKDLSSAGPSITRNPGVPGCYRCYTRRLHPVSTLRCARLTRQVQVPIVGL